MECQESEPRCRANRGKNSTQGKHRTTRRDINQRGNSLWLPGVYTKTPLSASFLISLSSKSVMLLY
jgi:hypothetical protein